MRRTCLVLVAIAAGTILLSAAACAAPSLPITKLPVVSGANAYTGPTGDPQAGQGQWFKDVTTESQSSRSNELYDNVNPGHGGGLSSTGAIYGKVTGVTWSGGKITAFTIKATITNDTPGVDPLWADGSNSHGETLHTMGQYHG